MINFIHNLIFFFASVPCSPLHFFMFYVKLSEYLIIFIIAYVYI